MFLCPRPDFVTSVQRSLAEKDVPVDADVLPVDPRRTRAFSVFSVRHTRLHKQQYSNDRSTFHSHPSDNHFVFSAEMPVLSKKDKPQTVSQESSPRLDLAPGAEKNLRVCFS